MDKRKLASYQKASSLLPAQPSYLNSKPAVNNSFEIPSMITLTVCFSFQTTIVPIAQRDIPSSKRTIISN
jgi:hypothetical protein